MTRWSCDRTSCEQELLKICVESMTQYVVGGHHTTLDIMTSVGGGRNTPFDIMLNIIGDHNTTINIMPKAAGGHHAALKLIPGPLEAILSHPAAPTLGWEGEGYAIFTCMYQAARDKGGGEGYAIFTCLHGWHYQRKQNLLSGNDKDCCSNYNFCQIETCWYYAYLLLVDIFPMKFHWIPASGCGEIARKIMSGLTDRILQARKAKVTAACFPLRGP